MKIDYQILDLPGGGLGSISWQERFSSGELDQTDLDELTNKILAGNYLLELQDYYITKCGDGRASKNPTNGAQVFGGSAGLAKSYRISGLKGLGKQAHDDIYQYVKDRAKLGIPSGGHRDNSHGKSCGCGECDRAKSAAEYATSNSEQIWQTLKLLSSDEYLNLANRLGIEINRQIFKEVVSNYRNLLNRGYFDDGPSMILAIDEADPDHRNIELLEGKHNEIIWVINLLPGTSIDREKLVLDGQLKGVNVFWEDQWAVEAEINHEFKSKQATGKVMIADITRRLATAMVLTKADLRLMILKTKSE